jgi:hypothetical protein
MGPCGERFAPIQVPDLIRERRLSMAEKCAHPACKCTVDKNSPFGKYCSAQCENKSEQLELVCDCGHPGCK